MNPQKRFGQIEEVLADLLVKVDRIADNQGKTLDLAVNTDAKADTIARAVANLTVENGQAHQQINEKLDGLASDVQTLRNDVKLILDFLREKLG